MCIYVCETPTLSGDVLAWIVGYLGGSHFTISPVFNEATGENVLVFSGIREGRAKEQIKNLLKARKVKHRFFRLDSLVSDSLPEGAVKKPKIK